jgi:hypothetical protein
MHYGSVRLRICKGEDASGSPIHEERYDKVLQGEQRIPWDLKARGTRVQAGRCTAVLVCTPDDTPVRPTNLISDFASRDLTKVAWPYYFTWLRNSARTFCATFRKPRYWLATSLSAV